MSTAPDKLLGARYLFPKALALIAAGFLGLLSGWMVGETGGHPDVVANVLPAVITGVGGVFVWFAARDPSDSSEQAPSANLSVTFASLSVVFFCVSFYQSSVLVANDRSKVSAQEVAEQLQLRVAHLQWCSEIEYRINKLRREVDLPPLGSEHFCRKQ